jgi:gluconolactonase
MGDVDVKSDRLLELLDPRAEVERLADGFWFTEGPVWDPESGRLYFSDMPGDVRRSWHPEEGVVEVRRPSNKCNGMAYDAAGGLLVCEHATSRLIREDPDGTTTIVASHYDGKELNSPNDVIVTNDGTIYFSDPSFGRMPVFGVEREPELSFRGLYRVRPGSTDVELVDSDFDQPNGLCTSPDESLLYVNDTGRGQIKVYDRGSDGAVGPSRLLIQDIGDGVIENGVVDGMKCDATGSVWVTAPGGIWIVGADGAHLGTIKVPENAGNLNWGGPDWSDLYMTCNTGLYRIATLTKAAPVPNTTRSVS